MAERRPRTNLESLTPDRRAKAEAILARFHAPEARAAEVADRQSLTEEFRATGTIESTGEPVDVDTLLRLRQLLMRLKTYREASSMTLAVVSDHSGIDVPALSRLENGIGNPTFSTLTKYAKALGVNLKFDYEVATS